VAGEGRHFLPAWLALFVAMNIMPLVFHLLWVSLKLLLLFCGDVAYIFLFWRRRTAYASLKGKWRLLDAI